MGNFKYAFVKNESGYILKNEISNIETAVYHLKALETLQSKGNLNFSRIFIVSEGNLIISNKCLEKRGICAFFSEEDILITAKEDSVILEINVTSDIKNADSEKLPYFLNYNDAETYKEDCKSEKTVNRFLLKHRIIPDIAIGSVEVSGPDKVGVHEHPFVEQLFFSFDDNDCNLVIDGENVNFKSNVLFHIPLASKHGVDIPNNKKAHYIWIDYIWDKKGLNYMDKAHKEL